MGDDALEFLNEARLPARRRRSSRRSGELQRFTPTIEALVVPDIDLSLDEQAGEDAPSGTPSRRSAPGGPSCRRTSARWRSSPALVVYYETHAHWSAGRAVVGRRVRSRSSSCRRCSLLVWLALPLLRRAAGCCPAGRRLRRARGRLSSWRTPIVLANFCELGATTLLGWWFLVVLRGGLVGRARRGADPVGRRLLGVARADEADRRAPRARLRRCSSFAFPVPGEHAAANLGLPDVLFFALFLAASVALRPARRLDVGRARRRARADDRSATVWCDLSGLPALPGISLGFLVPNADLLWRAVRRARRGVRRDWR